MCSFLLLFLILIIGFDFLQDSIVELYPETAIAPSTCFGQDTRGTCTASGRKFSTRRLYGAFTGHLLGIIPKTPSFLRRINIEIKKQYRIMEMELFPWRCIHCQRINKKVAEKCVICGAHWSTGIRHNTEPRAHKATAYRDAWPPQTSQYAWEEDWKDWQCHSNRSQSRSKSPRVHQTSQSPRGRKSKGKGVGKHKHKDAGLNVPSTEAQNTYSTSPFTPLTATMPPWPSPEGMTQNLMPAAATPTNSNNLELLAPETGMCCGAPSCLSGHQLCSTGDPRTHQKNGQGHRSFGKGQQQICYKEFACCDHNAGQGTEDADGSAGIKEDPSHKMDQAHHRSSHYVAGSAAGLPEAASNVSCCRYQSSSRHRNSPKRDTSAVSQSLSSYASCHATDCGSVSGAGRREYGCRYGGGKAAKPTPISSADLCRSPECGSSTASQRARGHDHGRRRARKETLAFHATLWCARLFWSAIGCQADLTGGGALLVLSHSLHGARPTAEIADAYAPPPTVRAACHFQLNNFDLYQFSHWHHSIQHEPNYLNPFDAVMSAWKLSWSVFQDSCDESLARPLTDVMNDHEIRSFELAPRIEPGRIGVLPLRSCIRLIKSHSDMPSRRVQFHCDATIHIGLEDELSMHCTIMNASDLATWAEKPWTRRPLRGCPTSDIGRPVRKTDTVSKGPGVRQGRLTDDFHNVPQRVAAASTAPRNAQPNHVHLPPPPAFVTDIFGLSGFQALPHDFLMENTFLIRTWYVHHYHFPRWVVPRFVELDHRWVLWQREISSSWRDMIQPQEDVHFFTVMPDPDRSFLQRQVVADVLVVQGTDADRFAGLLTVHHSDIQGSLRPFALAISLPDEVSGVGLAAAADISHLCNTHRCIFFFGWQQVPFSLVPSHYMLDGHGFAGYITPLPNQQAASSSRPHSSHSGHRVSNGPRNEASNDRVADANQRSSDAADEEFDYPEDAVCPHGYLFA